MVEFDFSLCVRSEFPLLDVKFMVSASEEIVTIYLGYILARHDV